MTAKEHLELARDIRDLLIHYNRPKTDILAELPPELEANANRLAELNGLDALRILRINSDLLRGYL